MGWMSESSPTSVTSWPAGKPPALQTCESLSQVGIHTRELPHRWSAVACRSWYLAWPELLIAIALPLALTAMRNRLFTRAGHSLGGALATLAAHDLQAEFGFRHLHCYTFGAPRTGNHTFAADTSRLVPETWHVINDRALLPGY